MTATTQVVMMLAILIMAGLAIVYFFGDVTITTL